MSNKFVTRKLFRKIEGLIDAYIHIHGNNFQKNVRIVMILQNIVLWQKFRKNYHMGITEIVAAWIVQKIAL